jgi:hypothetical protein
MGSYGARVHGFEVQSDDSKRIVIEKRRERGCMIDWAEILLRSGIVGLRYKHADKCDRAARSSNGNMQIEIDKLPHPVVSVGFRAD